MLKRFGHFLIWTFLFILILLAVDLSMIYIPSRSDGFNQIRSIYLDLRFRMLGFVTDRPAIDLEKFFQKKLSEKDASQNSGNESGPRFFYVDKRGDIHFVATLDEIPHAYRSQAQKLDR